MGLVLVEQRASVRHDQVDVDHVGRGCRAPDVGRAGDRLGCRVHLGHVPVGIAGQLDAGLFKQPDIVGEAAGDCAVRRHAVSRALPAGPDPRAADQPVHVDTVPFDQAVDLGEDLALHQHGEEGRLHPQYLRHRAAGELGQQFLGISAPRADGHFYLRFVRLVVKFEYFAEDVGPGHEPDDNGLLHGGIVGHFVAGTAVASPRRAGGEKGASRRHRHSSQEGASARSCRVIQQRLRRTSSSCVMNGSECPMRSKGRNCPVTAQGSEFIAGYGDVGGAPDGAPWHGNVKGSAQLVHGSCLYAP